MTYKVTVTEDVTSVSVSGNTTSINLTGEQTEISVVNPATSVTFNPSQSFTSTNVQDALFESHKMVGYQSNNYSVTLDYGNKFEIQSGSNYARFDVDFGSGGWFADIKSSDKIRFTTDGNLNASLDSSGSTFYDKLEVEGSNSIVDGIIQTNNTSGDTRHHLQMRSSGSPKGFLGTTSTQVLLGRSSTSVAYSADAFGGSFAPSTQFGGSRDGFIDLGKDDSRFRNLYLSDNLYTDNVEWADGEFTFSIANFGDAFRIRRDGAGTVFKADFSTCYLYKSGVECLKTISGGVEVTGTTKSDRFYCSDKTGIGVVTSHLDKQLEIGGYDAPTMRFRNYTFNSNFEEGDVVGSIEFYENNNDRLKASIQYEKGTQASKDSLVFRHHNFTGTTTEQANAVDPKFEITYAGAQVHNNFNLIDATGEYSIGMRNTGYLSNRYLEISSRINPADGIILTGSGGGNTSPNTLSHYEEGTWTPTLWNPQSVTLPIFNKNCTYVRIGCNVTLYIKIGYFGGGGSSTFSSIGLTNLPFSPQSNGSDPSIDDLYIGTFTHRDNSGSKTFGGISGVTSLGTYVIAPESPKDWNDTDYFVATITYQTDA